MESATNVTAFVQSSSSGLIASKRIAIVIGSLYFADYLIVNHILTIFTIIPLVGKVVTTDAGGVAAKKVSEQVARGGAKVLLLEPARVMLKVVYTKSPELNLPGKLVPYVYGEYAVKVLRYLSTTTGGF